MDNTFFILDNDFLKSIRTLHKLTTKYRLKSFPSVNIALVSSPSRVSVIRYKNQYSLKSNLTRLAPFGNTYIVNLLFKHQTVPFCKLRVIVNRFSSVNSENPTITQHFQCRAPLLIFCLAKTNNQVLHNVAN